MNKTDISNKYIMCTGCIHKPTKFFGKCIHCSRNPNTIDYFEIDTKLEQFDMDRKLDSFVNMKEKVE